MADSSPYYGAPACGVCGRRVGLEMGIGQAAAHGDLGHAGMRLLGLCCLAFSVSMVSALAGHNLHLMARGVS